VNESTVNTLIIAGFSVFNTAVITVGALLVRGLNERGARNEAHLREAKEALQAQGAAIAATSKSVDETKVSMVELERQTNSMKDALVKVTGEKSFAEGVKVATDAAAAMVAPPRDPPAAKGKS
jgi:hypothetical protein